MTCKSFWSFWELITCDSASRAAAMTASARWVSDLKKHEMMRLQLLMSRIRLGCSSGHRRQELDKGNL